MERKVLLICAGGMSTGILMKKMEKYAQDKGIDLRIDAMGMSAYEDLYKNYEVILLGPQVAYKKEEISQVTGMPIGVIAAYDYAIGNVENIMKQVEEIYPA
ncbi:MAG: PTS sugar transporter subunit IIB [Lachnospiraceae bacterium]|nr:PTS sugar transporter subunit IIB [Lachnospiraceae bacterium]